MITGFGPWGQRVEISRPATDAPVRETPGQYACESCGAVLTFKPGTTELACGYCGHRNTIAPVEIEIREQPLEEGLALTRRETLDAAPARTKCDSCAADFDLAGGLHAAPCPFCSTPKVLDPGRTRARAPEGVLPFLIGEKEARKLLTTWLDTLWFAPNSLREASRGPAKLHGIYVPHWTFDSRTRTRYVGRRGDVYYETRYVTQIVNGKQVRQRVQVPKIRWTPAAGAVARDFDDILVTAGTHLDVDAVTELAPWDLDAAKPYNPDYLSGFESELYGLKLTDGLTRARSIMQAVISEDIRRDIGGDQQVITSMQIDFKGDSFKLLLLPVWTAAFGFLGRRYPFYINGRTGEVYGKRPWSFWKITGAVLLAIVLFGAIALLAGAAQGVRF